jgi:putative hydrolase of the HAD superfamily
MSSSQPILAVLFDVGGPIVDDSGDMDFVRDTTISLLSDELGRKISDGEFDEARERAIKSYSPSFSKSVIWQYLQPDRDRAGKVGVELVKRIFTRHEEVTLTDGVEEVIRKLADNYILALAANQPDYMKEKLDRTGLMKYFKSTELSADLGLQKPDSRFFMEVCRRINVEPQNCVMIGDRLDNDIYPANILGMRTIWLKYGPHAVQDPRIQEDVPDATVEKMIDVIDVIERWSGESTGSSPDA